MCLPGLSDVAIAENLATEMHLKAIQKTIAGMLAPQPKLKDVLDYCGDAMVPAPESTLHPTAVRYNSQVQGAAVLREPEGDDSQIPSADFNQLQAGLTFPFKTTV